LSLNSVQLTSDLNSIWR